MSDYEQPSFYRFNEDSIRLVKFVLNENKSCELILDLGAGSGILGIELGRGLRPKKIHLVEVQAEYLPFLNQNIKNFLPVEVKSDVHICSFGDLNLDVNFDLIVCNPPYYFPDSGQASADQRRQIARSFSVDNWKILFDLIQSRLTAKGKAYVVLKNDLASLKRILSFLPKELRFYKHDDGDICFLILSRLNVD